MVEIQSIHDLSSKSGSALSTSSQCYSDGEELELLSMFTVILIYPYNQCYAAEWNG